MDEKKIKINEARKEARKLAERARREGKKPSFTVKSGRTSSLFKVIKTKEQADFFMKMLKSL